MVLVWAYCAPASDYPERLLKNYWSEVQRKVANPARPSGQCLFPANGKGPPARRNGNLRPCAICTTSRQNACRVRTFSSRFSEFNPALTRLVTNLGYHPDV